MGSLMQELEEKALRLGAPLGAHLDLTYRCNERCIHCYLDHRDDGEMTTAEVGTLLEQLAEAGVFLLTLSGGEPLLRPDFFEILEHARRLLFNVGLKTNATLIGEQEAGRIRSLGVQKIAVSIYSHRPQVHDAITRVPGSLKRSLDALHLLKSRGLNVTITHIVMVQNIGDQAAVKALAEELGVPFEIDTSITPKLNGDRSIVALNAPPDYLKQILHDEKLAGDMDQVSAPPHPADPSAMDRLPCSAGQTVCYISPYGDVYPCVQFPLSCGNVLRQTFADIWRNSKQLRELRSIRTHDLPICSACRLAGVCNRCPGLAYMEGDMRGPSTADCENCFARTGVLSPIMNPTEIF